jgi:glycosyltransferase involved in cell wall biosynthesis
LTEANTTYTSDKLTTMVTDTLIDKSLKHLQITKPEDSDEVIADQAELADYYAQADLFLFPSLYETLGLVAMEAASFGLPMVAQSAAPGLSEIFVNQASAYFSERQPEAYGRAILELVRSPEKARELGANASRAVHRIEHTVAQVAGIYGELHISR